MSSGPKTKVTEEAQFRRRHERLAIERLRRERDSFKQVLDDLVAEKIDISLRQLLIVYEAARSARKAFGFLAPNGPLGKAQMRALSRLWFELDNCDHIVNEDLLK
jgi:hypothetical protein